MILWSSLIISTISIHKDPHLFLSIWSTIWPERPSRTSRTILSIILYCLSMEFLGKYKEWFTIIFSYAVWSYVFAVVYKVIIYLQYLPVLLSPCFSFTVGWPSSLEWPWWDYILLAFILCSYLLGRTLFMIKHYICTLVCLSNCH